jgi:carbonic anhydrase
MLSFSEGARHVDFVHLSRPPRGRLSRLPGRTQPTERERYRELAEHGQSPRILIIGCCDSRVSPEVIFDTHPGELFVVRNIANLVPPYTPDLCHGVFAALEFAVLVLKVEHIVVLGHERCGGIRAFAEHGPPLSQGDSIHKWMSLIAPAAELAGPKTGGTDYLTRLEQASISKSLDNLLTYPYVRDAVGGGRLCLHGAYFNVATGQVLVRGEAGYRDILTSPDAAVADG